MPVKKVNASNKNDSLWYPPSGNDTQSAVTLPVVVQNFPEAMQTLSVMVSNWPDIQAVAMANRRVNIGNWEEFHFLPSGSVLPVSITNDSMPVNIQNVPHVIIDNLPAVSSGGTMTINSVGVNNFPETQKVALTEWPTNQVVSFSTAQHVIIDNLPASQSIANFPTEFSINNIPHVIVDNPINLPANTTVNIGNFPNVNHVIVDNQQESILVGNFPSSQNVVISNIPHVLVDNQPGFISVNNFPSNQNVNITNSGALHTIIDNSVIVSNIPATQNVSISNTNLPVTFSNSSINIGNLPSNQNMSVTNIPHVIIDSGNLSSQISNFPSGFNVNNIPHVLVDNQNTNVTISNFPSSQGVYFQGATPTVNIANIPHTIIDSLPNISVSNFPTSQNVNILNSLGVNNFPANQNVSITNIPHAIIDSLPNISIANFPASQNFYLQGTPTVNIGTLPTIGINNFPSSQNVVVTNTHSVNVANTPNVNVTNIPHIIVDSMPSSNTTISNLPTWQTAKRLWYTSLTAENKLLKTGPGFLYSVNVNKKGLLVAAIAVYDGTSASGNLICSIDATTSLGNYPFYLDFNNGLFIQTSSSISNITIVYC